MTKPQHQGSMTDQLRELIRLGNSEGLYDAADWVEHVRHVAEQIAAWLEDLAAQEREMLDTNSCRPDARERVKERWMAYKAAAIGVRSGNWRKTP